MLVIIEGVDGSGKSTLVEQLSNRGYTVGGILRNSDEQFEKYMDYVRDDHVYILDRSFITDIVYRIADGGDRDDIDWVEAGIILNNSYVVYCSTVDSFKRSIERGEDNILDAIYHDELENIYETLTIMIRKFTTAEVIDYDWQCNELGHVIKFIEGGKAKNGI